MKNDLVMMRAPTDTLVGARNVLIAIQRDVRSLMIVPADQTVGWPWIGGCSGLYCGGLGRFLLEESGFWLMPTSGRSE